MTLKKEFALKNRTRGNYSLLFHGKCQCVFADMISLLSLYSKSKRKMLCHVISMVPNYSTVFRNYGFWRASPKLILNH